MIRFEYVSGVAADGEEHTFTSTINKLTGDRMDYFDSDPPEIGQTLGFTKSVFKRIREKERVIEVVGDF